MICRQNRAIGFFIFKYFRETFFTEVTGTRISDHCVRNICIKASLKIAVLWILVRSKILGPKILVNSFKNIYNKCSCRSSARNLFHLQFHFCTLATPTFSNIKSVCYSLLLLLLLLFFTALCEAKTYSLCFFVSSKNRMPCTCFLQAGYSLTYFSEILHILK